MCIRDRKTQAQIDRGRRVMEIFKQPQYDPILVAVQVAVIWAVQNGYVDQTPVARVKEFQSRFTEFLTTRKADVLAAIAKEKMLGEASVTRLKASADEFAEMWKISIGSVGHGQPA